MTTKLHKKWSNPTPTLKSVKLYSSQNLRQGHVLITYQKGIQFSSCYSRNRLPQGEQPPPPPPTPSIICKVLNLYFSYKKAADSDPTPSTGEVPRMMTNKPCPIPQHSQLNKYSWMNQFAPMFPVPGQNIDVLPSPTTFYEALKVQRHWFPQCEI